MEKAILTELSGRFIARVTYRYNHKEALQIVKEKIDPECGGPPYWKPGWEDKSIVAVNFQLDNVQLIPADQSVTIMGIFGSTLLTSALLSSAQTPAGMQIPITMTAAELEKIRAIEVFKTFEVPLGDLNEYVWD